MDRVPEGRCWNPRPGQGFDPGRTHLVTASTLDGARLFADGTRLRILRDALVSALSAAGWALEAWVVLPNHYHAIVRSPLPGQNVLSWAFAAHATSAGNLNALDGTPGRAVWNPPSDIRIADEAAYLAGVRYVMENPVWHGYVRHAETWPFGWAGELSGGADATFMARVMSHECDRIAVPDALHGPAADARPSSDSGFIPARGWACRPAGT
jgi:REP element-mobilizing transposase RayT